ATRLGDPGHPDQVALGIGEVTDDQARWRPLRAHLALAAQAFCFPERGLDLGYLHVEQHVRLVGTAAADPAGDTGAVAGAHAGNEAVLARLGHRVGDRGTRVELPPEQQTVVFPQFWRVLPDDLKVHDRLSHVNSLQR